MQVEIHHLKITVLELHMYSFASPPFFFRTGGYHPVMGTFPVEFYHNALAFSIEHIIKLTNLKSDIIIAYEKSLDIVPNTDSPALNTTDNT